MSQGWFSVEGAENAEKRISMRTVACQSIRGFEKRALGNGGRANGSWVDTNSEGSRKGLDFEACTLSSVQTLLTLESRSELQSVR